MLNTEILTFVTGEHSNTAGSHSFQKNWVFSALATKLRKTGFDEQGLIWYGFRPFGA